MMAAARNMLSDASRNKDRNRDDEADEFGPRVRALGNPFGQVVIDGLAPIWSREEVFTLWRMNPIRLENQ